MFRIICFYNIFCTPIKLFKWDFFLLVLGILEYSCDCNAIFIDYIKTETKQNKNRDKLWFSDEVYRAANVLFILFVVACSFLDLTTFRFDHMHNIILSVAIHCEFCFCACGQCFKKFERFYLFVCMFVFFFHLHLQKLLWKSDEVAVKFALVLFDVYYYQLVFVF